MTAEQDQLTLATIDKVQNELFDNPEVNEFTLARRDLLILFTCAKRDWHTRKYYDGRRP